MLVLRCLQGLHESKSELFPQGGNLTLDSLSLLRSLSHVGCRFLFFFFLIKKISLSVYFPVAQYVGISQSSPFTVTLPSKIEVLCLASWKVSALFEALLEAFHSVAYSDLKNRLSWLDTFSLSTEVLLQTGV